MCTYQSIVYILSDIYGITVRFCFMIRIPFAHARKGVFAAHRLYRIGDYVNIHMMKLLPESTVA